MHGRRMAAGLLLALLLMLWCIPADAAETYSAYSSTNPKILFPTTPRAYLYGTNRKGYSSLTVTSGGSISNSSGVVIGEGPVTVLGVSRLHHAFVKVSYYNPTKQTTQQLWVEAAHMRPYPQTRSIQVLDEDGNPRVNWPVRVMNGMGEEITTVYTDQEGNASYTGLYLDLDAAFSFADRMWSNETVDSGTLVAGNDCATFVSECLTVGGFCVYAPYASRNTSRNPGENTYYYGLFNQLTRVLGIPYDTKPSDGPMDVSRIYPGDVAFMHPKTMTSTSDIGPYGHTVLVHDVNTETQQVLTYSHTGYWHEWKDVDDPDHAILAVVHTSIYHFTLVPMPVLTLPETLTVPVGVPVALPLTAEPALTGDEELAWSQEGTAALRIDGTTVTAESAGVTQLTLDCGGAAACCQVTAVEPARLPEDTTAIGAEAFSGVVFPFLELPAGVTEIEDGAFDGCGATLIVQEGSPAQQWLTDREMPFLIKPAEAPAPEEPGEDPEQD